MKKSKGGLVYLIVILLIAAGLVGAIAFSRKKHPKSKEKFDKANGYNVDEYITLGKYKDVEVEQEKVVVTDEDVDGRIEEELEEEVEITGALKKEDFVNVDIQAKIDGQEVEDLSETDYDLCIGDDDYCEELGKAIIGKKKGDAFTITVKDAGKIVSSNYEGDDYKGKSAEVYVTINSAYIYVDHELTEEYVKEKFDCDSIDAFKKKIREDLEKETESDNAEAMKQDLFDKIVENAKMNGYPEEEYEKVKEETYDGLMGDAESWGMELEEYLKQVEGMEENQNMDEFLENLYKEQLKSQLVMKAICKKENIEITDKVYKERIEAFAKEYDYESAKELEEDYTKEEIKEVMLQEVVFDFLAEHAKIKFVEPSDDDEEIDGEEYYDEEDFEDEAEGEDSKGESDEEITSEVASGEGTIE